MSSARKIQRALCKQGYWGLGPLAAALLCTIVTTGCGGETGNSSATIPPVAVSPSPTSPPAPSPTPPAPTPPPRSAPPQPLAPPSSSEAVEFAVYPATIYVGENARLWWFAGAYYGDANFDAPCFGSGGWSGMPPNPIVAPATPGDITYTITCPFEAQFRSVPPSSVTVTVKAAGMAAAQYTHAILISDTSAGNGYTTDPNLVAPWDISYLSTQATLVNAQYLPSSQFIVANHGSQIVTQYDDQGSAQPSMSLPPQFTPTGMVVLHGSGIVKFTPVASCGVSPCQTSVIATSDVGQFVGWGNYNPTVLYSATDNAQYTGLSSVYDTGNNTQFIAAADFRNGKIDVFDGSFVRQLSLGFVDPALPPDYAPFGIHAVSACNGDNTNAHIYVTFAQHKTTSDSAPAVGAGLGIVDEFDMQGNFVKRLVSPGGALNAPWGVALAPYDFGALSNTLLVGNSGDGKINAYDPNTGQFVGMVLDSSGIPIQAPGLRALTFFACNPVNGELGIRDDVLFYSAAGPDGTHGSIGNIYLAR